MPKLIRRDTGEAFELPNGVTQVGRLSANDIQVFEPDVSRSHCHLQGPEGGWVVIDHGSDLGTYVNGSRVRLRGLYPGDQIRIGKIVFVFDDDPKTTITRAGIKLRPLVEASVDELIPPELFVPPPPPMTRRTLAALVAAGAAVVLLGIFGIVQLTRQTPRRFVEHAAKLAAARDAEGLLELVSADRRRELDPAEVKRRLDALPFAVLEAVAALDAREGRATDQGTVVPIAIEVEGRRLADEVILREEEGEWRIHDAPVHRLGELLPAPQAPATPASP